MSQLGARLKLGNCRASVDTASASLDSRTATEPVISSRLLLPPPRDLHPPLYGSLEPPRIVCRVVLQPSVAVECNGGGDGGGGGNRPEPDARLQVQEALTRGSSMRELAYRRVSQFDRGISTENRDSPPARFDARRRKAEIRSRTLTSAFLPRVISF